MPAAWAAASASSTCAQDREHRVEREPAALEPRAQRLAFEQVHHQVEQTAVLADVVDPHDPGVGKPAHQPQLAAQPLERVPVLAVREESLDRDVRAREFVQRPVDLARAAAADPRLDPVAPGEGRAGREQRELAQALRRVAADGTGLFGGAVGIVGHDSGAGL